MLPANNISLTKEYDHSVSFMAQCSCTDPRHTQVLDLEYEEDLELTTLTIYATIYTRYHNHYCENWRDELGVYIQNVKRRWHHIWELLTTGQTEAQSEFIFDNPQQIDDYIGALQYYKNKMEANKH
jgi:hypothetical protein